MFRRDSPIRSRVGTEVSSLRVAAAGCATLLAGCVDSVALPEGLLQTSVLVSHSAGYRVDTLDVRPAVVDLDQGVDLLTYFDRQALLPWPGASTEVDRSGAPAGSLLVPMPTRWYTWRDEWVLVQDCGDECDLWMPSRWGAPALSPRVCPALRVVDSSSMAGDRAALWEPGSVAVADSGRLRILKRGQPNRVSPPGAASSISHLASVGDKVVVGWFPLANPLLRIDELSLSMGRFHNIAPAGTRGIVAVLEPPADSNQPVALIAQRTNDTKADVLLYTASRVVDGDSWVETATLPGDATTFSTQVGYASVRGGTLLELDGESSINKTGADRLTVVGVVDAIGLLAAGEYRNTSGQQDAVLIRFDQEANEWLPYAALPSFTGVSTMVAHDGGVLFGATEGIGYYSRMTGECVISSDVSDVSQILDTRDGAYFVRGTKEGQQVAGWLVP